MALAIGAIAAAWAFRANRSAVLTAAVAAGFAGGGALLSVDAWREAWRPPLRIAFEEIAEDQDGTAFAIVTGVLRSDAVQRQSGVSLSLDVMSVRRPDLSGPADGADLRGPPYTTVGRTS